jgi:hypothetical protein
MGRKYFMAMEEVENGKRRNGEIERNDEKLV